MNKNNPIVSVIMAAYNNQDVISESIESILNQTFKDFELIIINDNSTDNTEEIIKSYLKKDKRIKYFKNEINKGAAVTRNIGIENASGKYIAILDGDDIALPTRLEKQVDFLKKNKEYFLVGGQAITIDLEGNRLSNLKEETNFKKIKKILPKYNCFIHSTVLFRNKGYKYRNKILYSHDYDLFLRMLSDGKKLANLSDILSYYRINPYGISSTKKFHQEIFSCIAKDFYKQRKQKGYDDYDKLDFKKILEEKEKNKCYLEGIIYMSIYQRNYNKLAKYSLQYLKKFGIEYKKILYLIYAILLSLFNFLRKKDEK